MDKNRNKIISVVLIVLCVVLIILALVIVKKYSSGTDKDYQDNNVTNDSGNPEQINVSEKTDDNGTNQRTKSNSVKEDSIDIISPKTELIMQKYYIDARNHDNLEESKENMPSDLVAMSEGELEDYLENYMDDMPLNEYLNGLLSYEIVEFSNEKVVLRKTYAADWNENEFYLCDENGNVVVYYSDKETVYEYTGIKTSDLSSEEQVRLKIGYYVANEEELYALLESYSS